MRSCHRPGRGRSLKHSTSAAPKDRSTPWPAGLARATLILAVLLLLAAGCFFCWPLAPETGGAWLGYYYAAVITVFEVPAVLLAVVVLRAQRPPLAGEVCLRPPQHSSRSARCCSGGSGACTPDLQQTHERPDIAEVQRHRHHYPRIPLSWSGRSSAADPVRASLRSRALPV